MNQKYFEKLESSQISTNKHKVVIPLADNEAVCIAIKEALEKRIIYSATLIGNPESIKNTFGSLVDSSKIVIIEAISEEEALLKSINEIKTKKADIIMKGMCQSASLIKAVLDRSALDIDAID